MRLGEGGTSSHRLHSGQVDGLRPPRDDRVFYLHLTPYTLRLTPYALRLTPYAFRLTPYSFL